MSETPPSAPAWLATERDYDDDLGRGTLPELFETSAKRHLDAAAQRYKGGIYDRSLAGVVPSAPSGEYASLSYREMRDVVRHLAAGFRAVGIDRGDRVGILSDTRMEWAQADLALLAAGAVVTTVYTDSSTQQIEYLLDDPGASGVVVENESLLERLLTVEDSLDLEVIVLVDEPSSPYQRDDVVTLGTLHDRGAEAFRADSYEGWLDATDPGDLASLIYTSGTTGRPKGVRLTHRNFRSNIAAIRRRIGPRADEPDRVGIDADTTTISFLPLAHVFERLAGHFLMLGSGATVGYAESTDTVTADIAMLSPNAGASVPRVYERIFRTMREEAGESGLRSRIFEWSLEVATQYQTAEEPGLGLRARHALADRLVYDTLKQRLGGEIEVFVSGGGSLSEELCRMFNGMGVRIIEGYGLTETAPVISVNAPDDIQPGTVGPPLVGVDVAVDRSAGDRANLDIRDPDSPVGELLVRGPNVTDGYWERPGATEAAFVEDPLAADAVTAFGDVEGDGRWLRTGDLVELTPRGYLVIHDRLKQILVLDTGKNIAPQPIEGRFSTDERVEQILVVGDDRKFVAALVVPDFDQLREWATTEGVDLPDDPEDLTDDERVIDWVADSIEQVNEVLGDSEKIKKFALVAEEWTPENELLTPSLKKRRRDIHAAHTAKIAEIYEE
jgi:long-chain acyl-CoA synthetase